MILESYLSGFTFLKTFKETGQKFVRLASHPDYGRVVVKTGKLPDLAHLNRAKREVLIQQSINSPYYPHILEFIPVDTLGYIIVEEFIEGKTLSEKYNDYTDPKKLVDLLEHLVHGLILLWEKNVAHRDVKPDNIIIRPSGLPVIIDLGIILVHDLTTLTHPLAFRGPCTPIYAAPEQLKNCKTDIDHRTDEFILGIDIMQLILKGGHPFDPAIVGNENSICENILNGIWHRDILEETPYKPLQNLICKILGKEPYLRYRDYNKFLTDIIKCKEIYS